MSVLCSIHQLSLSYPEKVCFDRFTTQVYFGQRIAVVGDNGCGKTSFLRMLAGQTAVLDGSIRFNHDVGIGYVAQIQDVDGDCSGAQQFQQAFYKVLSLVPDLLVLDEPTNHLDADNKKRLLSELKYFPGTVIVASHDIELLTLIPDTLWSISEGKIASFNGHYKDFLREKDMQLMQLNQQLAQLKKEKKATHNKLMKAQQRAKGAKSMGQKAIQNKKWPTISSPAKMSRATQTFGKQRKNIRDKQEDVYQQLCELERPSQLIPTFHLRAGLVSQQNVLMIKAGRVGYSNHWLSPQIDIQLQGSEKMAILGANGSGKSTLVKAIMNQPGVLRDGEWYTPKIDDIGYLEQGYYNLRDTHTVLSTIETCRPDWTHQQVRAHLNDFLFKSNQVVQQLVHSLSGGEKARLSLAKIAARLPALLILDEVTNNLDMTTRNHVIQSLKDYPGPMLVISHDSDFLEKINIHTYYHLY